MPVATQDIPKPKFNPDAKFEPVNDSAKPAFNPKAKFEPVAEHAEPVKAQEAPFAPSDDASNYPGFGSQSFDTSSTGINDALRTKQAQNAIDKLAQDTYQKQINGTNQNSTSEKQPIPTPDIKMLPQDLKASREAFQDVTHPTSPNGRSVLEETKRITQDEDYNKGINTSFYKNDRGEKANPDVLSKIKKGEYGYDLNKQRPTVNLGAGQAFISGIEEHYNDVKKADDLTDKPKEEVIADMEKDRISGAKNNPDTPIPKSQGWASLTNMVGQNATGFAKAGAAAVVSGAAEALTGGSATPALVPTLGALFMSHDAGKQAAGATFNDVYNNERNKGAKPEDAYETAMQQAKFNGASTAAQMALMSYSGIKSGSKPLGGAVYGKGFKEFLKSQASNVIPALKNLAPELGIQSSIAGGIKALQNMNAGKPAGDDVAQAALGTAMFLGTLHAVGAGAESLTPRGKEVALNGLAHSNPDMVEQGINQLQVQKSLTPEQADNLRHDLNKQRELNKGLPENVPDANKQKIQDLIVKRNDLENKIDPDHPDFVDKAFHPDIKEQINGVKKEKADGTTEGKDGINEKIRQLSEPVKQEESPNFHEEALVKEPDVEKMVSKLPDTMQNMYKQDPEGFLKFIADQAHGGEATRTELESGDGMSNKLIDYATSKYPEHTLSAPKIEQESSDSNTDKGFQAAGNKSKETQDPSHLGNWILDNSKDGDKIQTDEDNYYLVKRRVTKKGHIEIELEHHTRDEDGNWSINNAGVKILTTKYRGTESESLGTRAASDLHTYSYSDMDGHRKVNTAKYIPKTEKSSSVSVIKPEDNKAPNIVENIKSEDNATKIEEPGKVDVGEQASNGETIGSGDSGSKVPPGEGKPEETKASGKEENERVSGIAQRVQEQLGLRKYEKGKGWSKEESLAFGKAAIAQGADPYKAVSDPSYGNLDLGDRLAIAQAHDHTLNKEVVDAEDKHGFESPEYKEAVKNLDDFAAAYQPLKTESSRAFTAQQGSINIDTGNFTSVKQAIEKKIEAPLDEKQTKKAKELTTKNKALKKNVDAAEEKLVGATDAALGEQKEKAKPTRARLSTQLSDIAKRLRTSSEFDDFLKGASGDAPQKMGVDLPRLKEIAASILEDAAKAVKAGENAIDFIRDAVAKLKEDVDKDKLTDALTAIGEKQGLFDVKEPQLGQQRSKMEKPLTEHEQVEADTKQSDDLAKRFVDKKDDKFTAKDAADIWGYMKDRYLKKGIGYRDAIVNVSDDLGLSYSQISKAILTPKTKPISDAMWKHQYDLDKNRQATERFINAQGTTPAVRGFKHFVNFFRELSVFGHGGVFVGTHAGMTLMDLPRAWHTLKALFNAYNFAYGKEANYAQAMAELKSQKNYVLAQRAGLKNNPDMINNDAEIIEPLFGKISGAGKRGFNAVKILRQAIFDSHYNALSAAEKADPASAVSIAELANLGTGASNLSIPPWVNDVTFAGGMESARWGKLTRSPIRATGTALKAIFDPQSVSIGDKVFAKVWAKRVGTQLATYAGLLTLNAALQNSLTKDPNKKVNLTDFMKSDWMKMKIGDTTFDFTSGMLSTLGFIKSIIGQAVTQKPVYKGDDIPTSMAVTGYKYGIGKLSPFYGDVAELATQHDYNGNTLPWSNEKPLYRFNHKLTWPEYISSKSPLPVAEAFKTFYEQANQQGTSKDKLDMMLDGLRMGIISGGTGFKAYETHENIKTKKDSNGFAPASSGSQSSGFAPK